MRVGWLADHGSCVGGAELTSAEFRAAAPDGIKIVDLPPGSFPEKMECDRYVIQNCVQYTVDDLKWITKPTVKYWHDVGPHIHADVKAWLAKNAVQVCCSPVQADYMGLKAQLIPPPVDLARFEAAATSANGSRSGAVCVGSWRNFGKAPHRAAEWAEGNIDFFGGGPFAPDGSAEVAYDAMPELLARYQTFVFLPTVIEPFGRVVAEAYAAGCEVVTNKLVGARYWLERDRIKSIESAGEDFWKVVLADG